MQPQTGTVVLYFMNFVNALCLSIWIRLMVGGPVAQQRAMLYHNEGELLERVERQMGEF
jgi:putative AlgH/UPF0301 family transcriptional regulator